jgi:phosphatidate cytidylyltransferase
MLRWRLTLGALFIAGIIALCWWDHRLDPPGTILLPLALVLSVLASREILWLTSARGLRPSPRVVYLGNLLIVASNLVPVLWPRGWPPDPLGALGWPLAAFALMVLAAFCGEMRRYEGPGHVMEQLTTSIFALSYVGLLFSFLAQLWIVGGGALGVPALASLVIVVKMGDTGAYTVGRLVGRHKLAPVLSPGKTIEGAIGGLIFSCIGSWFAIEWLLPLMRPSILAAGGPSWGWLAYGLIVGVAGMLGDLAESLIKRDLGRKDSSDWMPGFGGVLDVLDSILFAAPVAYLCWALGLLA